MARSTSWSFTRGGCAPRAARLSPARVPRRHSRSVQMSWRCCTTAADGAVLLRAAAAAGDAGGGGVYRVDYFTEATRAEVVSHLVALLLVVGVLEIIAVLPWRIVAARRRRVGLAAAAAAAAAASCLFRLERRYATLQRLLAWLQPSVDFTAGRDSRVWISRVVCVCACVCVFVCWVGAEQDDGGRAQQPEPQ